MKKHARVWLPAMMLGFACGEGGGDRIEFGVPRSTLVSETTDAQWVRACHAALRFQAAHEEHDRHLCIIFGAAFAEDAAECEAQTVECFAEPMPWAEDCESWTVPESYARCGVTVGEVEDCQNAQLDANAALAMELDCSFAGDAPRIQELLARYEPPECADLRMRCEE